MGIVEVEELRHIYLRCISFGQSQQAKTGLNQFEDRREIRRGVRNVILLRERRDDEQRNPVTCKSEVASRPRAIGADVAGKKILRADTIWNHGSSRRNVIVESAAFVVREDEHRILPVRTSHH